jgi:hypothetical protein
VTIAEDAALNFAVPATAFTDRTRHASADGGAGQRRCATRLAHVQRRTLTGTPPANYNGSLALKVTASDGEYQVSQSFALVVTR